jgi:4-hydroxy-3-methylbut-2-enyl diphosphate reductase IspH
MSENVKIKALVSEFKDVEVRPYELLKVIMRQASRIANVDSNAWIKKYDDGRATIMCWGHRGHSEVLTTHATEQQLTDLKVMQDFEALMLRSVK